MVHAMSNIITSLIFYSAQLKVFMKFIFSESEIFYGICGELTGLSVKETNQHIHIGDLVEVDNGIGTIRGIVVKDPKDVYYVYGWGGNLQSYTILRVLSPHTDLHHGEHIGRHLHVCETDSFATKGSEFFNFYHQMSMLNTCFCIHYIKTEPDRNAPKDQPEYIAHLLAYWQNSTYLPDRTIVTLCTLVQSFLERHGHATFEYF